VGDVEGRGILEGRGMLGGGEVVKGREMLRGGDVLGGDVGEILRGREVLEWEGMDRPHCGAWVPGPHLSSPQSHVLVVAYHHHMALSLLFVVGGAGALAAVCWQCMGPHSPYASGGVVPCLLLVVWGSTLWFKGGGGGHSLP